MDIKRVQTFDEILIFRKEGEDVLTQRIAEIVKIYATDRNIPVSFTYPDSIDVRVMIVSIGGDGTMLAAMRAASLYENSTVLGLNTGSLGFLTEELPDDWNEIITQLDNIRYNKFVGLEKRMAVKADLFVNDEKVCKQFLAVNEFILTADSINAPLITNTYINSHFVNKQLGSGILIGTATGSTAMSLSAGGAIVSPCTNIIQIVPLTAHTLTSMPVITSGKDSISVTTELTTRVPEIEIHSDGRTLYDTQHLPIGTEIKLTVFKQQNSIKIWRPENWNFFDVLKTKMKW